MKSSIRQSGIDILGPAPWGTHFCMFYQTKDDLLDILIPYFKAGLENNEYCMWVTSEPLNAKDAEKAMRVAIPDFDKYLQKNQIEIIPYTEWYVENNEFDSQRVLNGWVDKYNYALDNGFKGLRLTGNTFWSEDKDWKDFTQYEEEVNEVISTYNMIAVCTYPLEKCGSLEILDVVRNHQYALFRREGSWEIFKGSEQTKIEQKLKESEEKHRVFMETARDFMHIIDKKGKIIYANRDFVGYKKEELMKMHITELIAEETLPKFAQDLKNLIKNGRITLTDLYCKGKDGTKIIGELSIVAIYNTDGKFNGARGIFKDITERREAEIKLKTSEESYKNLSEEMEMILDHLPNVVVYKDTKNNLIRVNKFTADAQNMTKEEMMGKSCFDLYPKEEAQAYWDDDLEVINSKKPKLNIEEPWKTEEGARWALTSKIPHFDSDGNVNGIIALATDITERKFAEDKLKESETKLRGIMNSITDQVCILDRNLDILYINSVAEEIYGPSALGSKCYQIYHGLDEPCSDCQVRRTFEDSEVHNKECIRIIGEESRYCWCVSNVFERDEEERPISVVEVSRDITERKKIEQELKESEEKFRNIADQSLMAISIMQDDVIKYANQRLADINGYSLEEIMNWQPKEFYKTIAPESLDIVSEQAKKKQLGLPGAIPHNTLQIIKKSGEKIWIDSYSKTINFKGKPAVLATFFDITERKKVEQELKESEEKWRALSENSPAHVLMLDREQKIIFINRTVPDLSKEEVIGTSIYNYTPQEFHKVTRDCYHSVWETGEPSSITTKYITNEGGISYFDMWVGPVYQSEKVVALITHSMDVTERKKYEEEIRLQSKIIENMSEGVYLIKLDDGTIFFTNPAFEEMFGYNPGEMIGKNVAIVNAPTDKTPEETKEEIMGILEDTGEWHGEVLNIKKDGTPFWCHANVSLFDHPEYGRVIVSVHTDITERKKADQKLKESEKRLFTLLDGLPAFIYLQAPDYSIRYANQYFQEKFSNDLKRKCYEMFNNYNEPCEDCATFKVFDTNIPQKWEWESPEGEIYQIYDYPFKDLDGSYLILELGIDITERKQAEQKLKESEDELGERVKELTCLYGLSKLVENPVISLEDILDGTLNLIPPAWKFPDITTARITYGGRDYILSNFEETEWKLSTKVKINEKPLLIEIYYLEDKPFLKEEQDLIIDIGIRLKVTLEEREAQKMLRISEEKYRMGFESSTDGIASADMEGTFLDFNNAFLKMLGYSREELLKLSFREITPQEWHEMEDNMIISQLSDGKDSGIYEKEYIRKDGTIFPVNVRFWIIKDDQGDPVRMWGIVREITEQKKAEEEIMSLAKFPSENPNPVLRTTRKTVIYSNKMGESLFNVKEGERIPRLLEKDVSTALDMAIVNKVEIELNNRTYSLDITPIIEEGYANVYGMDITERKKAEEEILNLAKFPSENPYPVLRVNRNRIIYVNNSGKFLLNVKESDEIPKIIQKEIKEAFESNSIAESEVELKNRFYSFIITPLIEKGYVNIYGMDITEKKQVEQKLKEINKLKSEFLRRASHELKTPLISIKGFSDLILALHKDQINPDVISKLNEINQGCERLQNIINNLLTTSRLESPDIKPKVQREDLTFLIKYCVHELQSLAQTRNQIINLDIHDGQYATFEKEEIHDVISNLLTNAIKYTPPHGKIDVKTDIQEKIVVISIKDNGIGFTKDEKKKIFQQFGKIERYGQGLDLGIDGTGLGLYISKRIVESHGGKIWMESEGKNQGSTFYFSLPLIKD